MLDFLFETHSDNASQYKAEVFDGKVKILDNEIKKEIDKAKISPSRVNSWLDSPGDYIMGAYFENKVQKQETPHLIRGNWFHSIMEDFYAKNQNNRDINSLKESARRITQTKYPELGKEKDHQEWLKFALKGYYSKWGKTAQKDKIAQIYLNGENKLGLELFVNGKLHDSLNRQCLGFIDRLVEGEKGLKVQDWKTGKTISDFNPNKPISSNNSFAYWRQQIFYTLLLEGKGFKIEEASLLFPCTEEPSTVYIDFNSREAREQTIKDVIQFDREYTECIENDYTFPFKKGKYNGWASFLCGLGSAKKPDIYEDKLFQMVNVKE